MFEVRVVQTKVMFKLDLKHLITLDPKDEEEAEFKLKRQEKQEEIPLENDGMTRIIGTQKYRQTAEVFGEKSTRTGTSSCRPRNDPTTSSTACGRRCNARTV